MGVILYYFNRALLFVSSVLLVMNVTRQLILCQHALQDTTVSKVITTVQYVRLVKCVYSPLLVQYPAQLVHIQMDYKDRRHARRVPQEVTVQIQGMYNYARGLNVISDICH